MKMFYLKRVEDESGVSGTGRIAQGFIFDNGKVALTWLSEHPSVTIYDKLLLCMVTVAKQRWLWNLITKEHIMS